MTGRTQSVYSAVGWLLMAAIVMGESGSAEPRNPDAPSASMTLRSPCASTSAEEVTARLRSVVDCYVEKGRFAGSILVARGERILLADGWGYANREWGVANGTETRFRLGSLTKAFTGVLVMRLVEDGELQLSDPIGHYVSGLPKRVAEGVTLRHLLTHTSGLQEFYRIPAFQRIWLYEPPPIEDLFRAVADQPLEFLPGERYEYRNVGFMGLGYVVEQVTGLSYEQALQTYVFGPAGMDDSGVEQVGEVLERMATGYAREDEGWREGTFLNPEILHAAGGIYSTATDLFRFSRALDTNELLTSEIQQRMFTPRIKERQDRDDYRHYAFGWHVDRLLLGEEFPAIEIVEHGGDVTSFETLFTRVGELDAVIVILYNHGETDQDAIRDDLIRVLADAREGSGGVPQQGG